MRCSQPRLPLNVGNSRAAWIEDGNFEPLQRLSTSTRGALRKPTLGQVAHPCCSRLRDSSRRPSTLETTPCVREFQAAGPIHLADSRSSPPVHLSALFVAKSLRLASTWLDTRNEFPVLIRVICTLPHCLATSASLCCAAGGGTGDKACRAPFSERGGGKHRRKLGHSRLAPAESATAARRANGTSSAAVLCMTNAKVRRYGN